MRRRTLKMDDMEIVYSPLTIEQAEEHDEKILNFKEGDDARPWLFHVAANGLNNALTNGDARWTVERIKKELDPVMAQNLWRAVLEASGYEIKPPGENAARDSASPSSAPSSQP